MCRNLLILLLPVFLQGCLKKEEIPDDPFLYLTVFIFFASIYFIFRNRKLQILRKQIINELEITKQKLRYQTKLNDQIISNSKCGVMVCTNDGQIQLANEEMVEIFDLPSIEAMKSVHVFTYIPFVQANISDSFASILEKPNTKQFDFFYTSKWGKDTYLKATLTTFQFEDDTFLIGYFLDVTELENLKEKLKHSHKMESLGVLAGGIVHDFNNILGAIMGYSEMTMLDISDVESTKDNLTQVKMACNRAKDLVSHILSFTREEEREKKAVNVSMIVNETLKLLRASLPSTIEINVVKDLDPSIDEDLIYGNSTEIHQILMNLCTNASHAMEGKEGKLDITISNEFVSESTFKEINEGTFIKLSIADNGHGMDAETVKKIFDPYFTTKDPGHGTGMGLFVVQGIILNHGGVVKAESKSGIGTTFHIYLPSAESGYREEMEENSDYHGSKERIFLVDDEEQLIKLGKKLLERLNYKVTVEKNPTKALSTFKEKPYDFDLIITDMTMPGITGDILSREILKIRPEIPIIICTGYSDLINEEKARKIGVSDYIMKPLGKSELGKVVKDVLDKELVMEE
ncbi:MAG: response regulator [Deltaproteobacteria bacterium]|nr:response regulator [Deltaproteobacteria bacterium]